MPYSSFPPTSGLRRPPLTGGAFSLSPAPHAAPTLLSVAVLVLTSAVAAILPATPGHAQAPAAAPLPAGTDAMQEIDTGVATIDPAEANDPNATLLRKGWTEFRLREFTRSVRVFEKLAAATRAKAAKAAPGTEAKPRTPLWYYRWALFGQACCWNCRQDGRDGARATALLKEITDSAPASDPVAQWAAFDLVRVKHLASASLPLDFADLARSYMELWTKFPNTAPGTQGLLMGLTLQQYAELRPYQEIADDGQRYIEANPTSPYTPRFYSLVAGCYQRMGQPDKYIALVGKMLETQERDPTNPRFENAGTYWRLAYEAEFVAGDFETARKYYRMIQTEYPRVIFIYGVEQALKRMDEIEAALREGKPLPEQWLTREAAAQFPTVPAAVPTNATPAAQEGR